MRTPTEYTLVERPILDALTTRWGYRYLHPSQHPTLRPRENEVLFLPLLVDALVRLNGIPRDVAEAIAQKLAGVDDNREWLDLLRGKLSHKVPGEDTHRTIRLLDFDDPTNNDFAVTNQLTIHGASVRRPDVIVYVNGLPLVVIEAKSPLNPGQNTFDAVDQIRLYEREIPRLFATNLFNIATNDLTLLYGATGAPAEHWARWRDPWPMKAEDFADETAKGLYALLEPSRLLDLLAHFIVFETRDGKTIKKLCRYQQFRAVNKMVARVVEAKQRAGLVWHTQGSGKSLTMVFAALKLKFHRGITSERLRNPNLLVITDRIDLHEQIATTFEACGLPNPVGVESINHLREVVRADVVGRTVLTTIFKFRWDEPGLKSDVHQHRLEALRKMAIPGSDQWILMVDEAHRTQEKDLGAYLRAVLPDAVRFGFTGTPVKKGDLDTFENFGVKGEAYLDKYGIDDAVADGATVPIYYVGRPSIWELDAKLLDGDFDTTFQHLPEEQREELRRRGVTKGDLARFEERIRVIANDIWTHYSQHVLPDGFKAQIVAIDRLACVAYKRALDAAIAKSLRKVDGLDADEAEAQAKAMSVCIYSPGQHDAVQHPELVEHQIAPEDVTPKIVPRFLDPKDPLRFLIVCNKLLTGFDAPLEQVLYLDNPLTDHNLLQAIARTNRRYLHKDHGLIVDYIGVSKKLAEALAAYRREDIEHAMRDRDALHDQLRAAHRAMFDEIADVERTGDPKADVMAVLASLDGEDAWFTFRGKADALLKAYGALHPDPRVLPYLIDVKFIGACLPYGLQKFEQKEEVDWRAYSEKIRGLLKKHLDVTGLAQHLKTHSLTDPAFWDDFEDPRDLKTAAVRKLTELKKETSERAASNPARYDTFSQRVKELIEEFQQGLFDEEEVLERAKAIAEGVREEDGAHEGSGLSERAYGVAKILEKFQPPAPGVSEPEGPSYGGGGGGEKQLSEVELAAAAIDALYASDQTAPTYWQDKEVLKKELRGQVRRILQPLGLPGWQKDIPIEVEHYAVRHYRKP